MARRSLGKLDRSIDVSRHLIRQEELSEVSFCDAERADHSPLFFFSLFGRIAPVEFEIGCGKGLFLKNAARQAPEHDFLGVEIGKKYAHLTAIGLAKQQLSNARVVCGDAFIVLRDALVESSLKAVHVYFPDPWWKREHRKRRVLRREVLELIENRLLPGGLLHFRTDVEEYFYSTLSLIDKHTRFRIVDEQREFLAEQRYRADDSVEEKPFRTHFERRTLLHAEPVYRAVFERLT